MRRRNGVLSAFFSLMFLMGCSVNGETHPEYPGWERFQAFSLVLENESNGYEPSSFHQSFILEEIADLDEGEQQYVLGNREFPRYFKTISNYLEKTEQDQVCLVLNGVSPSGDHASLLLSLTPEEGVLKFGQSLMHFVDHAEQWLTSAECPGEFLMRLHQL